MYDAMKKEDGGWDISSWMQDAKPALKEKNPLMNLPYICDSEGGEEFYVAQTNACFMYLARKLGMAGSTPAELSACEQLLCEIMDVRNKVVGTAYDGPANNCAEAASKLFGIVDGMLEKLSLWLQKKGGRAFLVGNSATAPDFHLFEMLDQLNLIAAQFSLDSPVNKYSALATFYTEFKALPENQKYLSSPLAALPMNNKMASFGAVEDGGAWSPEKDKKYSHLNGVY